MIRPAVLCVLLSACAADLPPIDGSISDTAQGKAFPRLGPIDGILAEAERPSRAAAAEQSLRARGNTLARQGIPAPTSGGLEARGRRLRERAAALRAVPL
ncbi:hypothetical protein JANAI62_36100 [Jannaschia pagri]|uniref:Uncharacterized protein n=1 Tax=Jannaschia pagri TaxID=2829797 RepID=A0ABQ4NS90_9RHOB|nr:MULTISPECIES: hypothetical protein [unclassified Jannaschia]GIT93106.1 hypothetical protein JANAI61_35640 [Jannaschia sp. AI_61]GIT96987.1 hypothetical protein JANAI62_36100 [Jannaschia sp. AI_62]